ncbi:MAG TPA: transcriptional regulator [Ignavibacteria bacterium]|nr:transcriptional regulator [Ignavibacteria bacterium]HMR41537.1 transcriptional regulator [Ignavibacteria bacterium]
MDKNISYRSGELLKKLNSENKSFFTIEDAQKILNNIEQSTVRKLLSDMTKRGLIMRVKDGLYNIIPYEINSEYFPNWHLVADKLVQNENYYIGFYSAMDIHGLITQPSLIEYIVSKKQIIPKKQIIKNVKFEFIKYNDRHFFGFKKTWIDNFNKVWCSDLEKTIIDCLYKPQYSSGITETIKAIYKSKDKLDSEKMKLYLDKFNAQVVLKRLGYILENFTEFDNLLDHIKNKISESYTYFDPSFPKQGKSYSRWKIIDNVNISEALNSLST